MRPVVLILGSVLLVLAHLEAVHNAYRDGRKDALSIKEPISEDLEMACLRLWLDDFHQGQKKNPTWGMGKDKLEELRI